jgi:hypothetical protein
MFFRFQFLKSISEVGSVLHQPLFFLPHFSFNRNKKAKPHGLAFPNITYLIHGLFDTHI